MALLHLTQLLLQALNLLVLVLHGIGRTWHCSTSLTSPLVEKHPHHHHPTHTHAHTQVCHRAIYSVFKGEQLRLYPSVKPWSCKIQCSIKSICFSLCRLSFFVFDVFAPPGQGKRQRQQKKRSAHCLALKYHHSTERVRVDCSRPLHQGRVERIDRM